MRLESITPQFLEFIPKSQVLEPGILYVSETYKGCTHLCACGCNEITYIPFISQNNTPADIHKWGYQREGDLVTLHGSVGQSQLPCKSHYLITRNEIIWLKPMS